MKTIKDKNIDMAHERFMKIIKLVGKMEKTPRYYGTDQLLSSSEIHLLEVIGDHKETLSVTDLAKRLGVTKGAISQSLKKLESKGFTDKTTDPENLSRTIVQLTAQGKTAFYAHLHWHEKMDGGYKDYVSNITQDQLDFLNDFLEKTEDFLKRRISKKE